MKPENILLDKHLVPKICDFGWSVKLKRNEVRNTFCGTYEYMAPEIFESDDYNSSIDVWSMGILLYEMIHGYSPFKGKSAFKIFGNIIKSKIKYKKDCPKGARRFINACLEIQPQDRLKSQELLKHPFIKKYLKEKKEFQEKRTSKKTMD